MRTIPAPTAIALFIFFLFFMQCCIKDLKKINVTNAVNDAYNEFAIWVEENPDIYIGLSDKGKALLCNLITCYDDYCILFPDNNEDEYRESLLSLFDDLPPRPHKPSPKTLSESPPDVVTFFL